MSKGANEAPLAIIAKQIDLIKRISNHIAGINFKIEEMTGERKKANKFAGQKNADAYCTKVKPYLEHI